MTANINLRSGLGSQYGRYDGDYIDISPRNFSSSGGYDESQGGIEDILQYSWNNAIKELQYTVNSQNTGGPLLTATDAAQLLRQGWRDANQQGRTPQQKYEQAISYALDQIGY